MIFYKILTEYRRFYQSNMNYQKVMKFKETFCQAARLYTLFITFIRLFEHI